MASGYRMRRGLGRVRSLHLQIHESVVVTVLRDRLDGTVTSVRDEVLRRQRGLRYRLGPSVEVK